jgi:predicted AAA+ superfamily ATPase
MKRKLYNDLKTWKAHLDRRPLLLLGVRQVGKTWLMKEFGKNEYKNVVYMDFFNESEIAKQFDYDLNPERIIAMLSAEKRKKITPADTLNCI